MLSDFKKLKLSPRLKNALVIGMVATVIIVLVVAALKLFRSTAPELTLGPTLTDVSPQVYPAVPTGFGMPLSDSRFDESKWPTGFVQDMSPTLSQAAARVQERSTASCLGIVMYPDATYGTYFSSATPSQTYSPKDIPTVNAPGHAFYVKQ